MRAVTPRAAGQSQLCLLWPNFRHPCAQRRRSEACQQWVLKCCASNSFPPRSRTRYLNSCSPFTLPTTCTQRCSQRARCVLQEKADKGGEDAHFVLDEDSASKREHSAAGVADGVGGWAQQGVDAGLYSRSLMEWCRQVIPLVLMVSLCAVCCILRSAMKSAVS